MKNQGVVEVHRVTVKKEGKVVPTNILFLTFNRPDMAKKIKVGYLKVKVDLSVPNLLRCFNGNNLATQASVVTEQPSVNGVGKISTKSNVMDPCYAPTAMALTLHLPRIARSGRRRGRFNAFALYKKKREKHLLP